MANKHAVVRTDRLTGTDDRARLISVRYQPSDTMTAIDNGNVVLVGELEAGANVVNREIFKGGTPTASSALRDIVLIATPEVMYDERLRNLDEFTNEAGKISRGYRLHTHDVFSVTAEALEAANANLLAKGSVVELMGGTKMKVVATATNGSTTIGKIIDVNVVGRYTYYAIEVQ